MPAESESTAWSGGTLLPAVALAVAPSALRRCSKSAAARPHIVLFYAARMAATVQCCGFGGIGSVAAAASCWQVLVY